MVFEKQTDKDHKPWMTRHNANLMGHCRNNTRFTRAESGFFALVLCTYNLKNEAKACVGRFPGVVKPWACLRRNLVIFTSCFLRPLFSNICVSAGLTRESFKILILRRVLYRSILGCKHLVTWSSCIQLVNSTYYIRTSEIPGELSRENLISSHVKHHRCYGYIINRVFHTKKLLKWNGLVVHWCLYNK